MIKEYQHIIDRISNKFNNVITSFDIILWLDNFKREDWRKALIVLENFDYLSTNEIIKQFEFSLNNLLEDIPKGKIYFIPVGRIGKSGSAMIYYLKKTPSFSKKRIELLEKEEFSTIEENANIVLVDDFSGTANTIIEFIEFINHQIPSNRKISVLTIIYMQKAKFKLNALDIKVYGDMKVSVFRKRGSVFGYYPKMRAIREFCFEYGNKIYPLKKYSDNQSKLHPLGYANSQVLLGFEHSIPNNTLPIIWSDKNWIPIFPRRGDLLINKANKLKQSDKYWSSIFFNLGLNLGIYSIEERYNRETLQILSVIRLKRRNKSVVSICNHLGINLNELDEIINVGITKGIFNKKGDLTEQGVNIFEQVNKKAKFLNKNNQELIIEEDMIYIPKTFRGSS